MSLILKFAVVVGSGYFEKKNHLICSKKPWCSTQESEGDFWNLTGRGRCRLDCEGDNLASDLEANLAKNVNINKYQFIINDWPAGFA